MENNEFLPIIMCAVQILLKSCKAQKDPPCLFGLLFLAPTIEDVCDGESLSLYFLKLQRLFLVSGQYKSIEIDRCNFNFGNFIIFNS